MNSSHWIGLHRDSSEHPWRWTDNTEYNNTYVFTKFFLLLCSCVVICVCRGYERWKSMSCQANWKRKEEKKMNPCAGGVAQGQRVCINATANPQKTPHSHKLKCFGGFPVYWPSFSKLPLSVVLLKIFTLMMVSGSSYCLLWLQLKHFCCW